MFYGVASPDWKPGQPLAPAGALLFRTRSEAESFAPEAAPVAVAVRFDGLGRRVHSRGTSGRWSAPAVGNSLGGITVFGTIPAGLVLPSDPADSIANGCSRAVSKPAGTCELGFGGWDSLTMALLA